ncbi:unnamed protein product [Allacma fusca]|uniref:Uncharacterized protein n=1 Tax=Allacma fusca TaxID=39272 RepID=A0A8J2L3D7_9HEXA|nr:unnamed protein product [Allacma fusca]
MDGRLVTLWSILAILALTLVSAPESVEAQQKPISSSCPGDGGLLSILSSVRLILEEFLYIALKSVFVQELG